MVASGMLSPGKAKVRRMLEKSAEEDWACAEEPVVVPDHELKRELVEIGLLVADSRNPEWTKRVKALQRFRAVLAGGSANHPNIVTLLRDHMREPINLAIQDLRSAISKEACHVAAWLCKTLPSTQWESMCDWFLLALFKISVVTIAIISQSSSRALRYIVTKGKVNHRTLSVVLDPSHYENKHATYRQTVYQMMFTVLHKVHLADLTAREIDSLTRAVRQGIVDPMPEVRKIARMLFWPLQAVDPHRASELVERLDEASRKHVSEGRYVYESIADYLHVDWDNLATGVNTPGKAGSMRSRTNGATTPSNAGGGARAAANSRTRGASQRVGGLGGTGGSSGALPAAAVDLDAADGGSSSAAGTTVGPSEDASTPGGARKALGARSGGYANDANSATAARDSTGSTGVSTRASPRVGTVRRVNAARPGGAATPPARGASARTPKAVGGTPLSATDHPAIDSFASSTSRSSDTDGLPDGGGDVDFDTSTPKAIPKILKMRDRRAALAALPNALGGNGSGLPAKEVQLYVVPHVPDIMELVFDFLNTGDAEKWGLAIACASAMRSSIPNHPLLDSYLEDLYTVLFGRLGVPGLHTAILKLLHLLLEKGRIRVLFPVLLRVLATPDDTVQLGCLEYLLALMSQCAEYLQKNGNSVQAGLQQFTAMMDSPHEKVGCAAVECVRTLYDAAPKFVCGEVARMPPADQARVVARLSHIAPSIEEEIVAAGGKPQAAPAPAPAAPAPLQPAPVAPAEAAGLTSPTGSSPGRRGLGVRSLNPELLFDANSKDAASVGGNTTSNAGGGCGNSAAATTPATATAAPVSSTASDASSRRSLPVGGAGAGAGGNTDAATSNPTGTPDVDSAAAASLPPTRVHRAVPREGAKATTRQPSPLGARPVTKTPKAGQSRGAAAAPTTPASAASKASAYWSTLADATATPGSKLTACQNILGLASVTSWLPAPTMLPKHYHGFFPVFCNDAHPLAMRMDLIDSAKALALHLQTRGHDCALQEFFSFVIQCYCDPDPIMSEFVESTLHSLTSYAAALQNCILLELKHRGVDAREQEEVPFLFKLLDALINHLTHEAPGRLPDLVTTFTQSLYDGLRNERPDVRKQCVFCFVSLYLSGVSIVDVLRPLSTSQLKLITIYVNRRLQGRGKKEITEQTLVGGTRPGGK